MAYFFMLVLVVAYSCLDGYGDWVTSKEVNIADAPTSPLGFIFIKAITNLFVIWIPCCLLFYFFFE